MEHKTLYWEDVEPGEPLPRITRHITTTAIISMAIAARDFMPTHHDYHFAQRVGARDIFLSGMSTTALANKYLDDWCGPEGELKRLKLRFLVPCFAGDDLVMTGAVSDKYVQGDEHLVKVRFEFTVPHGSHCTGEATVAMPFRN